MAGWSVWGGRYGRVKCRRRKIWQGEVCRDEGMAKGSV